MLFFIDETWQKVGGVEIGALGGVAFREDAYNPFCREVFKWKQRVLGAKELSDAELKGNSLFAKSAFRHFQAHGRSSMLEAADELFGSLEKYDARAFVVWTRDPKLLTLRNPRSTFLSAPYKTLLHDMRKLLAESRGAGQESFGSLNFDQRAIRQDESTGCAIQNFMVRPRNWWIWKWFQHVPNFTVSSLSPGLQAADIMAFLGANYVDTSVRPELQPYLDRMEKLMFVVKGRTCVREVRMTAPQAA